MSKQARMRMETAEAIVRRVADSAIRLAFIRWDLQTSHVRSQDEIVSDIIAVLLGEDIGCLDPEDLTAENCELLFVEEALREIRASDEYRIAQQAQDVEDARAVLNKIRNGWQLRAETAEAALTQAQQERDVQAKQVSVLAAKLDQDESRVSALMEALEPFATAGSKIDISREYFVIAARVYEQVKEKI